MTRLKTRCMIMCGVAAMLLAVPAESRALDCLGCLFGWCGGRCATPYAASYAPAYSPAPVAQTCSYVPQTCYRSVCQTVPVTTCRAITSCDPCSGSRVVTYRPITTWTQQTRLIPYTTYRLVYSNPYAACTPCGPCGTTAGGCSAATYSVPSACGCAPIESVPLPSGEAPTSVPSLDGAPPAKTFEEPQPGAEAQPDTEERLKPIPSANSNSLPTAPRLFDPNMNTTARPIRQATYFSLIPPPPPSPPVHRIGTTHSKQADLGGWRASHD
ncbi:MAG: hypothetical protein JXB62_02300 [Pirellulales bacterium]|nr:hypothetical protein [Pirellulales bacterium]